MVPDDVPAMTTPLVVDTLLESLQHEPSRPRLTCYAPAGRTELSGAALRNWAAKVAGLLVDELGAGPGDEVLVATPSHWQTAGILIGAWWAGLVVTDQDDPGAAAAFVPPGADSAADEVFVVSGHPLGLASRDLAGHQRDYTTSVLVQADRFTPRHGVAPVGALRPGSGKIVPAGVLRSAVRTSSGIIANQRVLTTGAWTFDGPMPAVVELLLRPLTAGASVIQSLDLDLDDTVAWVHRAEVEKADVTLGVDVPGLPRLG